MGYAQLVIGPAGNGKILENLYLWMMLLEELGFGLNGGLIYCMEHLQENLDNWLEEELENYLDDDYLVFDCPGLSEQHAQEEGKGDVLVFTSSFNPMKNTIYGCPHLPATTKVTVQGRALIWDITSRKSSQMGL